jgi:ABC-type transport system substrate-binding protein
LPDHFGESYVTFGNSCLTFAPVELTPNVAVSQALAYTIDPALSEYGYFAGPPDFGALQAVVTGLPEGVTATAVQDPATGAVNISLTGTPTTPGAFVATVFFSAALDEESWWAPLTATIPITVAAPTLAATGLDQRGILVGAGFLVLAGWAIARTRRARRR